MIIGFISKGYGILVLPALVVPVFSAAILSNLFFPGETGGEQMWLPGIALVSSAVLLFLAVRYFRNGARPISSKRESKEYEAFNRRPKKAKGQIDSRSSDQIKRDFYAGWFMFIPTQAWPWLIGGLGIFLIAGGVVESLSSKVPAASPNETSIAPP